MEFENSLTKGVDKFESGVAKAKDKIDSIGEQTKEQYQNWKRVLSGALNDKQLIIALTILFGFYLFFSGFNTILGGNAREENTITCTCPTGHSAYYRTLVIATVVAWVVCFVLTMIWDTIKFWRYVTGKRTSLSQQTSWGSADIENAKDHASSMLEQTIGSVEEGAQAVSKIPVKSIFTKAMGIVEDTLGMVDEGAKTLHKIDSGLKEAKKNPLESVLNRSMGVVDDVVTQRLGSNDESAAKVFEPTKLSATTGSLLKKATEMVSIAKQDPTLAKVVNPLDEKAQELKHSSVGLMLTKSVELVEDGMQTMNQNPAELMVSKAMDFVDDKAQINSAELIAQSKELVDQVKDNPTDSLLTGSMDMIGNAVLNNNLEGVNALQSVYPPRQTSEVAHDATLMSTSSMLSTAVGMVGAGLHTLKQDPEELALSKAMEFAADKSAHRNPTISKTVGLLATAELSDDPANSLMQDAMEMAEQNPTVTETMTSLNNGSLTYGGSLLSTATGMVDSGTEQIPEKTTVTKAIGFAEDGDDINQKLTKSVTGLATNVLSSRCPSDSPTVVQANARSVLMDAVKVTRKPKTKKSRSKKSLLHSRQQTEADTNALRRLKHYEDYLWLQFYKVYSVGATLQGEDQVLPAFIHVIGDDHKDPDGYETSADDEIKPLIEEKKPAYPKTELVEVQSSHDDDDDGKIPAIVIEPDFSDENHDTEEDHNADKVPTIIIESNNIMSGEISDTMSYCYDTENHDSTAVKTDRTTYSHDINLRTTNQDDMDLTSDLIPTKDHPLASAKLTQSNTSLLSVQSNSTQPNSTHSTTSLLSVKSNSTDKEEEDLLASWIYLKPVGLYNEAVDEENVVMAVADATCARVSFFLYPMLVLTRLLSQSVLVPLLLFQILDTYAWICITGDIYCSSILNQYRLGLDKAALAFTFYCCLLASILATAILRWFPCSKYARKAGATCIM